MQRSHSFSQMKLPRSKAIILAIFFLAACGGAAALSRAWWPSVSPVLAPSPDNTGGAGSQVRHPVLVELFTSEGCSSCPPADALLARLDAEQFVPGAQAIVLSEHVTYWNHEGWQDPYSLDEATFRQQAYAERFGPDTVYTPEAVIDGEAQVVGSDEAAVRRTIAQAAAATPAELEIEGVQWQGNAVHFKVHLTKGSPDPAGARLSAALASDSAQSSVKTGENAGRTLRHVAVVRTMQELNKGALDGRDLALKLPGNSGPGPVRLVVFLTDKHSGHILGATEQTLTR